MVIIMALPAEQCRYTFSDVLTWNEDERVEIIDGEAIMLATPSTDHQLISGALFAQLYNFLEGKKCRVISAPFAVRLFEQDGDSLKDVDTVVEPDLSVVCDREKLDGKGCKGAPDMIIEILSPSTHRHDRITKYNLYQRAGVREYWIVEPETQTVQVFLRNADGFLLPYESYSRTDVAKVNALNGCFIELSKVFSE